ncbi:MAG: hypothetical protein AUJ72_04065 [Candidatus Omnitrophica bacterium CG1_02_46_14]|nr:MAG: hypothetical protein AUJ72_04065 [Candidatus Omnitrophica bacterium CG1_02_46_14]
MIATITLNPSIDQHIIVRNLVKDDANRAEAVFRYPGGKGVNVSKVIRELGGHTQAYALIGGFPGELWKQLVIQLNIPFIATSIQGDSRINTILTDLKDESQTRISAPGPTVSPKELNRFLKKLLSVRSRPLFWALGGSLAPGMDHSTYKRWISELQKNGVPCVLDTDNEALRLGVEAKPYLIKPNEYEMARLAGRSLKSLNDYLDAARSLVSKGIKIVIVSLGSRGALFVTENERFHVLTPKVTVKSKVGAGDSLIGGFLFGFQKKLSLKESAKLGVAASTSAVMREAPRLCLKSDISRLAWRVAIRDL